MQQYLTYSEKETKKLGKKLATKLCGVLALSGDLGAGKTVFAAGFAKALGIKEKIISPTFVLIRQHKIPKSKKILFHIDLYRLGNEKQLKDLGLKEILNDEEPAFGRTNHFILIEWAEKAKKILPKNTTWISFESLGDNKRKITVR